MTQTFKVANGDWVVDRRLGRPVFISGRNKLRQDVNENLAIATQPNGFGAGLSDLVGLDVDPVGFRIQVQRDIRDSILAMQRLQDRFLATKRTVQERIAAISQLTVGGVNLGGGTARTGYSFRLRIRPVAGETLSLAGAVT